MQGLSFRNCHPLLLCLFAFCSINGADHSRGRDILPALAWLRQHSNLSALYDPNPPAKLLDGRLTRGMCEKRILPDSLLYDQTDWYTYGEKQGEWLQRYVAMNENPICWGEGAAADKWFDNMLEGGGCDRPWMVMSEEDVPRSSFQQYTQEAPAVMGLDPLILEFCRNLTHDSRQVPHVNDPFWKTWKAAGMPHPEKSLGPMSTLEHNLLNACSSANRNILRVSAMAQAKTSWDMCANVEWVVCAAKGKLPQQGKTIEFATPPGHLDGNLLPTYREYRSNILRWSANYEVDIMAWTFYLNEICFLSELCDNVDELWTLKRGEPWVCKHSKAGEQRLKHSLKNAYQAVGDRHAAVARMLTGGHVNGGHLVGGHVGGGGTTTATTTITTTTIMATTTATTTMPKTTVTKVAGTMKVEISVQDNVTKQVLEEVFKKGIADALGVSITHVVKLVVTEIAAGSRRLLSVQAKQYEVSYEVTPPSNMDPDVLVAKASQIAASNTVEAQTFRQVLLDRQGVSQVHQVVQKIAPYTFEDVTTTVAAGTKAKETSAISAGIVVLIVLLVIFSLLLVVASLYMIKQKMGANDGIVALAHKTIEDGVTVIHVAPRSPASGTLLNGDVEAGDKITTQWSNLRKAANAW